MRLTADKFVKIVESLVERLDVKHLKHMDVSSALMTAMEQQGVKIGTDDADDGEIIVTVKLAGDTHENLLTVVKNCNQSHKDSEGATTHGELDISDLLAMLAEDAAMTNSRPGSWEGSNMQQVLDSHGYQ